MVDAADAPSIGVPYIMLPSKDEDANAVKEFQSKLSVPNQVETFPDQVHVSFPICYVPHIAHTHNLRGGWVLVAISTIARSTKSINAAIISFSNFCKWSVPRQTLANTRQPQALVSIPERWRSLAFYLRLLGEGARNDVVSSKIERIAKLYLSRRRGIHQVQLHYRGDTKNLASYLEIMHYHH